MRRATPWVGCILVLCACGHPNATMNLPRPTSLTPTGGTGMLRAGFARRDVTPPPGIGMGSYGADSQQSVGFRSRLYAKALVLEGRNGELLALVVLDIGQVSAFLHREVAAAVVGPTGIGADRLILSATHTHSSPGNTSGVHAFDALGGRYKGFDRELADHLVSRIADAVEEAWKKLRPARANWQLEDIDGAIHNRSFEAWLRNGPSRTPLTGAIPLDEEAVDRTVYMLRVDSCPSGFPGGCAPWGAFAVFAMHGTGIPSGNDLFDSDVPGAVATRMEARLASLGADPDSAFFMLANGAGGDVSPLIRDPDPCRIAKVVPVRPVGGERALPAVESMRADLDDLERCLDRERRRVERLADRISGQMEDVYTRAAAELTSAVDIERAFETLDARTLTRTCWPARLGSAAPGGAERGRSRLFGHKILGLPFTDHFREGPAATISSNLGCFGVKRITIPEWPGDYLPQTLQLGVARIDDMLLATVPLEPTTEVGAMLRRAVTAESAGGLNTVLVSLSNGYAGYATTPEEYEAQHYEGGMTIFGPYTAWMLSEELASLSASIARGAPTSNVGPVTLHYRERKTEFFSRSTMPAGFSRTIDPAVCSRSDVRVAWLDRPPGTLRPWDGEMVAFQRTRAGVVDVLPDAHPDVEIRALRPEGGGFRWEARIRIPAVQAGDVLQLLLRAAPGYAAASSGSCTVI